MDSGDIVLSVYQGGGGSHDGDEREGGSKYGFGRCCCSMGPGGDSEFVICHTSQVSDVPEHGLTLQCRSSANPARTVPRTVAGSGSGSGSDRRGSA